MLALPQDDYESLFLERQGKSAMHALLLPTQDRPSLVRSREYDASLEAYTESHPRAQTDEDCMTEKEHADLFWCKVMIWLMLIGNVIGTFGECAHENRIESRIKSLEDKASVPVKSSRTILPPEEIR